MLFRWLFRPFTCFDAPNDGAGGPAPVTPPNDPPTPPADKSFSQADVDKIVGDRLTRERSKLIKEAQDAAKAEADKAKLDETERLKIESAEKDKQISETTTKANARLITAEAKVQAAVLGIKPERINAALKLADLSSVEIGDDGEPKSEQVKAAVTAVLAEYPEFKTGAGGKGGQDFNGNTGAALTEDAILKMTPAEKAKNWPQIQAFYAARK